MRIDVPVGHPDFGKLVPCQCQQSEYRTRRLQRLAKISGMLPEEMVITLDDVIERDGDTARMVEVAREFIADPYGFLTLWGGVGNGKTLVLYGIVNALRDQGREAAYVRFKDLLDFIAGGFKDDSERRRYEFLKGVEVLAIDEVDKARLTEYRAEVRAAFLDDRYRLAWAGRAVTLFAMNDNPADFPPDIYDRLRDGRFVIVGNQDASVRPALRR